MFLGKNLDLIGVRGGLLKEGNKVISVGHFVKVVKGPFAHPDELFLELLAPQDKPHLVLGKVSLELVEGMFLPELLLFEDRLADVREHFRV